MQTTNTTATIHYTKHFVGGSRDGQVLTNCRFTVSAVALPGYLNWYRQYTAANVRADSTDGGYYFSDVRAA